MKRTRSVSAVGLTLAVGCAASSSHTTAGSGSAVYAGGGSQGDAAAASSFYGDSGTTYGNYPYTGATSSGDGGSGACMEYAVQTTTVTPQIFVVFDRSLSMVANGWAPAVTAIENVTKSFDNDIDFGLMIFPDAAGFTCTAATVDVPIKPHNASAIQSFLSGVSPWGNTPTAAALQTAHKTIGSGLPMPDAVVPPKYVVLITDGAPNCAVGGVDQAMVTSCVNEITAMAKDDVKTYVLGYHINDATEKTALDSMAAAGGTGDTQHRDIGDQQALETQFRQIVGAARSCDFKLDQAVNDPAFVSVKLDGSQTHYGDPNGWQIAKDMQSVTVQGSACETIRDGTPHVLQVQVECTPVL